MTRFLLVICVAAGAGGACGDSGPSAEVVVADARLGGAAPVVIGATSDHVTWSATAGAGTTLVAAAPLATLPATSQQLATSSGPVGHAGNFVVYVDNHTISRVAVDGTVQRITAGDPESVAGNLDATPLLAWTTGATVAWGIDDVQMMTTLSRIDRCDHARVTTDQIYVAGDGTSGRRLLRIDQRSGVVTPVTPSSTWAPMFPGGAVDSATYVGRIAAADDDGALWLVEEMPSGRGIVVAESLQGAESVLLSHLEHASGFFASADALYWQEGDALLTAPRTGGPASIVASLPGPAGALADGYVYFVDGNAIERVRVE